MWKKTLVFLAAVSVFTTPVSSVAFVWIAPTFDDAEITTLTIARPYMGDDIIGTLGVPPAWVGLPNRLAMNDLWQFQDSGWGVESHGFNHEDFITLSNLAIVTTLKKTERWFTARGIMLSRGLILPKGATDSRVQIILKQSGLVSYVRRAWAEADGINYPETFDRWSIEVISVRKTTTFAELKAKIDVADAAGGLIVLVIHCISWMPIDEYTMDRGVFIQLCDYIRWIQSIGQGKAITLSQGVAQMMRAQAQLR